MTEAVHPGSPPRRLGMIAMLVVWAAVLARTLGLSPTEQWPAYIAGFVAFLAVMLVVLLRPSLPAPVLHVLAAVQAAIILVLLAIDPDRDFVTVLFILECYQVAVVFTALPRNLWVGVLIALTGGSLALQLGLVRGLALALIPMAVGVVLATFVVVNRELDAERAESQRIVGELRAAQERLRVHATQADELAAIEQRARVARELEESVTGTLARVLEAGAAARAHLDEPAEAQVRLERLQELTKLALAQMRRVITELRPPVPAE